MSEKETTHLEINFVLDGVDISWTACGLSEEHFTYGSNYIDDVDCKTCKNTKLFRKALKMSTKGRWAP